MNIEWSAVFTGAATFLVVLTLKILLDLKVIQFVVKYFSWIPVRNYFRTKPISISGQWEQLWEPASSENFKDSTDRHSHPVIKQLGSYCYGEFFSKGITYVIFGRVIDNYLVGDWYDKNDQLGYFGTFQLLIINSNTMKGRWLGHSKTSHTIKGDEWNWKKII
jgi:hypothetical protein